MGAVEEAGKVATSIADTMKGTPFILAVLILIGGTLLFAAYLLGVVATAAGERNKTQLELIGKLVNDIRDCRQGVK